MEDLEVEPLRVALGIHIVLEPQVVLDVAHLDSPSQVAILKSTIENQHVFLLRHVYCVCMCRLPSHERIICTLMASGRKVEISLGHKFWKVFIEEFVEFILEVSFPRLFVKELICVGNLCRGE